MGVSNQFGKWEKEVECLPPGDSLISLFSFCGRDNRYLGSCTILCFFEERRIYQMDVHSLMPFYHTLNNLVAIFIAKSFLTYIVREAPVLSDS